MVLAEGVRTTADKRLRFTSPKFAYRRTSFIRETLGELQESWRIDEHD